MNTHTQFTDTLHLNFSRANAFASCYLNNSSGNTVRPIFNVLIFFASFFVFFSTPSSRLTHLHCATLWYQLFFFVFSWLNSVREKIMQQAAAAGNVQNSTNIVCKCSFFKYHHYLNSTQKQQCVEESRSELWFYFSRNVHRTNKRLYGKRSTNEKNSKMFVCQVYVFNLEK